MNPFKTHTGIVALLCRGNIDTDQIISKEFLKSIKRTGFGDHLFEHWFKKPDGKPDTSFELNKPHFKNASILITGNNFGCGSSREHAVWALVQYGFRAIIAPQKKTETETIPGFADIFRNNSSKNGLLLIELSEKEIIKIKNLVLENNGVRATINLKEQNIYFHASSRDILFPFNIDAGVKNRLLEGLDDIGLTEKYLDKIKTFENKHSNDH